MRSNTIKRMSIEKRINRPKLTFIKVRFVDGSLSTDKCSFTIIQIVTHRSHITSCSKYRNIAFCKIFIISAITNAENIRNLRQVPLPLKLRKSEIWD